MGSQLLWRPRYTRRLTSFIILMGKENCLLTVVPPSQAIPSFTFVVLFSLFTLWFLAFCETMVLRRESVHSQPVAHV